LGTRLPAAGPRARVPMGAPGNPTGPSRFSRRQKKNEGIKPPRGGPRKTAAFRESLCARVGLSAKAARKLLSGSLGPGGKGSFFPGVLRWGATRRQGTQLGWLGGKREPPWVGRGLCMRGDTRHYFSQGTGEGRGGGHFGVLIGGGNSFSTP